MYYGVYYNFFKFLTDQLVDPKQLKVFPTPKRLTLFRTNSDKDESAYLKNQAQQRKNWLFK